MHTIHSVLGNQTKKKRRVAASRKSGLDSRASPKSVTSDAAYSAPSTVCEDCVEDAPSREVAGQHHKVICVAHGLFHVKLGDEGNADVLWCQ